MSTQHDQDRDRIAEALHPIASDDKHPQANAACALLTLAGVKMNGYADARGHRWTIPPTLDAAIAAFETLCEPKGWGLNMMSRGDGREKVWYVRAPEGANMLDDLSDAMDDTWYAKSGNHAADVCRLVCMVLDREASDAK